MGDIILGLLMFVVLFAIFTFLPSLLIVWLLSLPGWITFSWTGVWVGCAILFVIRLLCS